MEECSKTLPKQLVGTVHVQWTRCNRPWCHCMKRGKLHGPYYFLFFRQEGRLRKSYIHKEDVERVGAACAKFREKRREKRREQELAWKTWREMLALLKELEQYERKFDTRATG